MTSAQRKTALGQRLVATPSAVSSAHTFLNVDSDVQTRARLSHCIRAGLTLQSPARQAAWDALRARAEELMREDAGRYGAHWMVWLSVVYAQNGWRWEAGAGDGDGEVEGCGDE